MRELPREQILRHLRAENPWWERGAIGEDLSRLRPREYLGLFLSLVTHPTVRRAVVLMGPRRVGKTVLIHHAVGWLIDRGIDPRRILYVSVDHPVYTGLGLDELLDLLEEAAGGDPDAAAYAFFDEIQYLRDWERHLKVAVDRRPQLKLTVSGSAGAALRLKSTESGAGRFTDFLLPPLSFPEYLQQVGEGDLVRDARSPGTGSPEVRDLGLLNERFLHYLNFGGYPEVVHSPEIQRDPGRFIKSDIIDKVLLRDLPSLYGIRDIQELNQLFTTLALNTAGELSLDALSQSSGASKNTIKRYVEYLEAAFLIKVVHRVDQRGRRFKRANRFKVYLTNPSMRAALFSPIAAEDEATGSLVETGIFAQWFGARELSYASWSRGEVDFVDPGSGRVIEVKWSDRFVRRPAELGSLIQFCEQNGISKAIVTTRSVSAERRVSEIDVRFIPAAAYCYEQGAGAIELEAIPSAR